MANQLENLFIDKINNKSIDVVFENAYTDDISFKISKADGSNEVIPKVVENTFEPSDNRRTLFLSDGEELIPLNNYIVTISQGNDSIEKPVFFNSFPPMTDANIDVYGDRILKVSFEYPVQNIAKLQDVFFGHGDSKITIDSTKHNVLANFYAIYYNQDLDVSSDPDEKKWAGFFTNEILKAKEDSGSPGNPVDPPVYEYYKPGPYSIRVSEDHRSIEIQWDFKSFPQGTHQLQINVNKDTEFKGTIKDYSTAWYDRFDINGVSGREFPITSKDFTIQKGKETAIPIDVKALSRTELIVYFNKPMLLLQYLNDHSPILKNFTNPIISGDGERLKVSNVMRYGTDFKALKFTLHSNADDALAVGMNTIKIDTMIDAHGYLTEPKIFDINVPEIRPYITEVIQDEQHGLDNTTEIKVTFSTLMNIDDVKNASNYRIVDSLGKEYALDDPTTIIGNDTDNPTVVRLITKSLLPAGVYYLNAKNMRDALDLEMLESTTPFDIEDYTAPKIVEILVMTPSTENANPNLTAEDNRVVIKFDEPMTTGNNLHSITNYANYQMKYTEDPGQEPVLVSTSENWKFTALNDDKWVRVELPTDQSFIDFGINYPATAPNNPLYGFNVGYCSVKTVLYVTNKTGNILCLCNQRPVDLAVEPINITKQSAAPDFDYSMVITNYNTLEIRSPENYRNELLAIDKNDFIFSLTASGTPLEIASVTNLVGDREFVLEFKFKNNVFDSNTTDIFFKTAAAKDLNSKDIFGKSIKENIEVSFPAINKVKSTIKSVSILDSSNANGRVALNFARNIVATNLNDFLVKTTNNEILSIKSAEHSDNFIILTLNETEPYINMKNLLVSTNRSEATLRTIDDNNNKIALFENVPSQVFDMTSLNWSYSPNDVVSDEIPLDATILNATFNRALSPTAFGFANNRASFDYVAPVAGNSYTNLFIITAATSPDTSNIIELYSELTLAADSSVESSTKICEITIDTATNLSGLDASTDLIITRDSEDSQEINLVFSASRVNLPVAQLHFAIVKSINLRDITDTLLADEDYTPSGILSADI